MPGLSDLLTRGSADVRDLVDEPDLIGWLLALNSASCPRAWTLLADPADRGDVPSLVVGLCGAYGFVQWQDGTTTVRPKMTRVTSRTIEYSHGDQHLQCDTGEEIPAEYVFAAVAEFVATRRQPGCIPWATV